MSDPVAVLQGIFAFAPIGLQVYRADGHCLVTNRASIRVRGEEPVRGWWDRQRLEQVITNLLTNA